MQHWDLTAANEGSRTGPQVLFSTPEARGVVVDLAQDEEMGDHQVRERALVQVLRGSIACTSGTETATCVEGALVVFESGRASYTARSAAHPAAPHASPVAGRRALRRLGRRRPARASGARNSAPARQPHLVAGALKTEFAAAGLIGATRSHAGVGGHRGMRLELPRRLLE
jgi:hypothetical protein